jgi:hypothetical protein
MTFEEKKARLQELAASDSLDEVDEFVNLWIELLHHFQGVHNLNLLSANVEVWQLCEAGKNGRKP